MLEVIEGGFHTTIQDGGRVNKRAEGIPISGTMDKNAHRLANSILGNPENEAVLEFVVTGPTLKFHRPTTIVLTGANFEATLNGSECSPRKRINVKTGDILKINAARKGVYGYLAIAGHLLVDKKFESKSFYPTICSKNKLKKGNYINFIGRLIASKTDLSAKIVHNKSNHIEVFKGPEFNLLSEKEQTAIFDTDFVVSTQSNRMSIQLDHQLHFKVKDITTSPVQPGVVQLTPSGKLMVLMQDAQTTGGYARILVLSEEARSILAQIPPERKVRLKGG